MTTIIQVVDSMVLFYLFHFSGKVENFGDNPELQQGLVDFIENGCLYPFMNPNTELKTVWLVDTPTYWKNLYVPTYKMNRKKSEDSLSKSENWKNFIRSKDNHLGFPQYESDDIAGAISWLVPPKQDQRLMYITTDSDWLGLLSKKGGTYCIDPSGFGTRVKNAYSAYQWYCRKYSKEPESYREFTGYKVKRWAEFEPQEIYTFKSIFGDSSDNLSRGTPEGLINLRNPVIEYDIMFRTEYSDAIRDKLESLETRNISPRNDYIEYVNTWGETPIQSTTVEDFEHCHKMQVTANSCLG